MLISHCPRITRPEATTCSSLPPHSLVIGYPQTDALTQTHPHRCTHTHSHTDAFTHALT